jgi:basic membrane lipoprotein Med (substrate-binding protein (PBP1-ABC) superfamily)
MKKVFTLVSVLLVLAMFLGACAKTPVAEPPVTSAEPLRVAVVSPSSVNDLAFTQSISDALKVLKAEMGDGLEYAFTENMFVVDDAAAAIRDYATKGYDIVIAHGSQYGSSLQEIAPDFPETVFAWGTTVDTFGLPNVHAYEAASDQGGYVNGVMAGMLTKSKIIGVVGPIETGDAKLYVDGFVAGAKSVDPTIDVRVTYIGSFSDVALAAEAATTHIAAGADILSGSAQMVVGAIGKAEEAGLYWFGTQSNQNAFAPKTVVASQVYHWEGILREIIALRAAGTLGGKTFSASLQNGGQVITLNPEIKLSDEIKAKVEEVIAGISDGSIVIPKP